MKNHYYMSHYYFNSPLLRTLLYRFTIILHSLSNVITIICPLLYGIVPPLLYIIRFLKASKMNKKESQQKFEVNLS